VALESLGSFGDRRLTETLLAQLQDPDPEFRGKVVEVLQHLGDARGTPGLLALLEDPDPGVRRRAATALGHLELADHASASDAPAD